MIRKGLLDEERKVSSTNIQEDTPNQKQSANTRNEGEEFK
jgi:hypothetical protein